MSRGRLEVRTTESADGCHVALLGQIDDRADLRSLVDGLRGPLVIDLCEVTFINSMGVREWFGFLRELSTRRLAVTLVNCSEPMVEQMNMIIDARAGATIESFFAPYLCDGCAGERSMKIETRDHLAELRALKAPVLPCPECGGQMRLAELEERYLLFLGD